MFRQQNMMKFIPAEVAALGPNVTDETDALLKPRVLQET
jgi:hypothetical protein